MITSACVVVYRITHKAMSLDRKTAIAGLQAAHLLISRAQSLDRRVRTSRHEKSQSEIITSQTYSIIQVGVCG